MIEKTKILGVLLAGGQARRMGGGDKCLLPLGGRTLLQRSIAKAQPQVDQLILSANGNSLRFARSRLPVVADAYPEFLGPLAGIHSAIQWARQERPETQWLASFACDTPFFPDDLVTQLAEAAERESALVTVAASSGRMHPIFALWHSSLFDALTKTLESGNIPPLAQWIEQQTHLQVNFSCADYDPFFNINQPQDLYDAEAFLPLADKPGI